MELAEHEKNLMRYGKEAFRQRVWGKGKYLGWCGSTSQSERCWEYSREKNDAGRIFQRRA